MKQQLRKPENWQDFEELCKVLWGEVWKCPEIKKNGRSGQNQNGVDICGIPKGENGYFGIQCKGKDEYTNAKLTEIEILKEIEKAKNFKPKLVKLIFATTANKDERIEEFFREQNLKHLNQDLFEVHLYCWEEIVDLIDSNKKTSDWYIRKQKFSSEFAVTITFENDSDIKEFKPTLRKNHITYLIKPGLYANPIQDSDIIFSPQPKRHFLAGSQANRSSCVFSISIKNSGNHQLESFKLTLDLTSELYSHKIVDKSNSFLDHTKYPYNIKYSSKKGILEIKNENGILVQNDEFLSDQICIRPLIEYPFCSEIPWKLISKDFTSSGVLKIEINTIIKEKHTTMYNLSRLQDKVVLENCMKSI